MATTTETELLFIDTFSHETTDVINLDLIQFVKPVIVKEVRVIPLGTRVLADIPGGMRLGATNPSQIDLDLFINNLKEQASTFEKLGNIKYKANVNILFEAEGEPIPTDGLVIRGMYTALTLAVYGNETSQPRVVTPPPQAPKTKSPEILTTRPIGGGIHRPDNLNKPPIDLPGVNQKVSAWLSMAPQDSTVVPPVSPIIDQRNPPPPIIPVSSQTPSTNDGTPSIPIESTGQVYDPRASLRPKVADVMPISVVTSTRIIKPEQPPSTNNHPSTNNNITSNIPSDNKEGSEIQEDLEMISDDEGKKAYEDISSGEDNLSDLVGVPSRKQLTDMDVSGLDIADTDGWTSGVACFHPYQFQLVPLEAFSDPTLTAHEKVIQKLKTNNSQENIFCMESEKLLNYVNTNESYDTVWVDHLEEIVDLIVPGLAYLILSEKKNYVLDILCEWALRGLDMDLANRQPVSHMVRHLKAGIRLTGVLCSCHDDIAFRLLHRDVQHQLVQLLGRNEMASSIKLLIVRSLDQTISVKDGLLWFIGSHPIQKDVEKCVYAELIEQVINDSHDERVLKSLTALCNKLNLYDSLYALNDAVKLTIDKTEKVMQDALKERLNDEDEPEIVIDRLECDHVERIVTALKHIRLSLINAKFTHSQPSRIPVRQVLYEVHMPVHDPIPDILGMFNSSGLLKACNVILTSPACIQHSSIIHAAKELLEELCLFQNGLLFLAFNPEPVNSILQDGSRDESDDGDLFVLNLVYHLQTLLYVDELKTTTSKGEYVLGVLHNIFVLTLSPIGKEAVVWVLSLDDNLLPILELADIGDIANEVIGVKKKSILLHYVFNLIVLVLRHSNNIALLLNRHGQLINKISKNEITALPKLNEKLHEMSDFLSLISNSLKNVCSIDVLPSLLEQLKRTVEELDCSTSIPKGLITVLRVLKNLFVQLPNNESPIQLVYDRAIAEGLGALHYLAKVVQKCADIVKKPWLKSIPLPPVTKSLIMSTLIPALSSLTILTQKIIKARNIQFKDFTTIETLFNAHAVFCSITPNGQLTKQQLEIQNYIIACLGAYTQPLVHDNKSVAQSTWTTVLKLLLNWMLNQPYTMLSGLVLLSELLPLPLPIQTKYKLSKDDIQNIIQPRKLWSAHLLPIDENLRQVIETLAWSSCSPLQHILKRVCWQLSDLASPSAMAIASIVLNLVIKSLESFDDTPNENFLRILNFIVFLVDKPSFKAAVLPFLKEEHFEIIIVRLSKIINCLPTSKTSQTTIQEIIISFFQCLCDNEVSLVNNSDLKSIEVLSNSLPCQKHIKIIINSLIEHICCIDNNFCTILSSLKTLTLFLEHDFGLNILYECLDEMDAKVFFVLFDHINGTFSKDSPDCIATLSAAVDVLLLMVQVVGSERKNIINVNRLKNLLLWPNEMHPLDDLETLLGQFDDQEETTLRNIHVAVKALINILKEEIGNIDDDLLSCVDLVDPLPLSNQFNLRTVYILTNESDENRLSDTYWLATPMADEDVIGERIETNLFDITDQFLSDLKLKEELIKDTDVPSGRRIRRRPNRRNDMINTSKTQGSASKAFAAPMRGRGFNRGGITRNDLFRSRPPNTSRPPSMHVDDFIKMEENKGDNNSVPQIMTTSTNAVNNQRQYSSNYSKPNEMDQQWRNYNQPNRLYASNSSNHYAHLESKMIAQQYLSTKFMTPTSNTVNNFNRRNDPKSYVNVRPNLTK